jgi:FlaA1/EpsC-like NDP-sugar epimerase/dTDP-4-amino-4,6-dideoxygalactose transaminase
MTRTLLSPPDVGAEERQLLLDAFDSNWIAPLGPHVDAFEEEFARAVQVPYAGALSSGTAALHLGLMLLGVGPGDEVLVSTLTFAATVNPIVYRGATPVFIDSDRDTWTMDPELLREELKACAARGRLPKAVVVVDLYGQCADYDRILAACEEYGVPVLEDAAEALGSTYRGVPAGNFGALAAFSFNGNKIITTSGGGMIVSRRSDWIERARFLSTQARDQAPHYQHSEIGYNYRISNLLAAVGRGQLRTLAQRVDRRRAHNAGYREAFAGVPGIAFMPEAPYGRSNQWLTTLLIDTDAFGASREEVRTKLDAAGIESRPVWKPMHLQPAFAQMRARGGDVSRDLFERGLCLPSGSSMTASARQQVAEQFLAVAGHGAPASARVAVPEMPAAASVEARRPSPDRFVPLKRWILRRGRAISVGVQIGMIGLANAAAFMLRFDGPVPDWAWHAFWRMLPILVVIRASTFVPFRLYAGVWQYASVYDARTIVSAVFTSTALFWIAVHSPIGVAVYPRSIYLVDSLVLICGLGGLRFLRRIYSELKRPAATRRVLVVGAGSAGELIVRDMLRNRGMGLVPVGFVDDDVSKHGRRIHGVPVLGGRMELPRIMAAQKPDEVVVALPSGASATLRSILRDFEPYKVDIRTLPSLGDLMSRSGLAGQIRGLRMEDLVRRPPVGLDVPAARKMIEGRSVLVTGAGGMVAAELCEQLAGFGPARVILLDRSESALDPVISSLEAQHVEAISVIGDIADERTVRDLFARHKPDIVFHAALHHNVRLMEDHPAEAVRNNVMALRGLAEAAAAAGVKRFVLLSTIKAVNASTVAGATARVAELLMRALGRIDGTMFSAVRLGSVLGRPGSVVPAFRDQIRRGVPITVSDPEVRRYFMLPVEAVQLALHAMVSGAQGGLYLLDMGEQVSLVQLARDVAKLEAGKPEDSVVIRFSGLRHGERLFDELAAPEEVVNPTGAPRVMSIRSHAPARTDVLSLCDALRDATVRGEEDVIRKLLRAVGAPAAEADTKVERAAIGDVEDPDDMSDMSVPSSRSELPVQRCPTCHGHDVHRSRARSVAERLKKEFTAERLYRCGGCGWRGWMVPLDAAAAASLGDTVPLDLSSLDKVTVPDDRDAGQRQAVRLKDIV